MAQQFQMHIQTFSAPNDDAVEQHIKSALEQYKDEAPKRGHKIAKGPFALVQQHLFDEKVLHIIVKALVTKIKKS
jgi:hypothetical protein